MARARTLNEASAIHVLQSELMRGPFDAAWLARNKLQGIGDDAAVFPGRQGRYVWSIDTSAEGVHFDRAWLGLDAAAARATTAAVSDLAAMGAKPVGALCALTLPPTTSKAELRKIARGQRKIAERHACPILGGNLCRGDRIEFTTTVLGSISQVQSRAGAKVGDEVWLVGDVGMAAAGLRMLQRTRRAATLRRTGSATSRAVRDCLAAWRDPRALVERGLGLVGRARSQIDVSDGLASEAGHLARASQVRLELSEAALREIAAPSLCQVASELGFDPLHLMLYGGEDYALLATGPARSRPNWAAPIGQVVAGKGAWLGRSSGRSVALRGGFDHMRS